MQLICAFAFVYAKSIFSYDMAHLEFLHSKVSGILKLRTYMVGTIKFQNFRTPENFAV